VVRIEIRVRVVAVVADRDRLAMGGVAARRRMAVVIAVDSEERADAGDRIALRGRAP
jgi:hypothetical protein